MQEPQNTSEDESLLQTKIDKETVVSFIEGMVQAMGSSVDAPFLMSQKPIRSTHTQNRKHNSKTVANILHKLERANKYSDIARTLHEDTTIINWVSSHSCKQKDYFEELECAEAITSFFAPRRHFDIAIASTNKAIAITKLHRQQDSETLSELYWVLADLYATIDKMDQALQYLQICLSFIESEPNYDSNTYKELSQQLRETSERERLLARS